jgi:hypothetical protein
MKDRARSMRARARARVYERAYMHACTRDRPIDLAHVISDEKVSQTCVYLIVSHSTLAYRCYYYETSIISTATGVTLP